VLQFLAMSNYRSIFWVILLVSAGHFSVDFMLSIWPAYKTMAHIDIGLAALIAIVAISIGEATQLLFGRWIDKGYQRRLLIIGPVLGAAAVLFPYFSSTAVFFMLLLCTTIGSAAFHPTAASILGAIDTPRKALIMGVFQMSGNVGLGLGQLFFSRTYEWLSGHTIVLFIPALIVATCAYLSHVGISRAPSSGRQLSLQLVVTFFRTNPLRCLYFTQLFHQAVLWSTVFLLPDLLLSRGFSSTMSFGGGHFALLLGAGLGCLPAGLLGDRFTPAKTILGGFISGAFFLYSLLFVPGLTELQTLSLLFCLGASIGPMTPLALALGTSIAPQMRGMVSAFLMGLVWIVSEGLGIGVSGLLADCFETNGPAKSLMCIGSCLGFGGIFAYQLIRYQHEEVVFAA